MVDRTGPNIHVPGAALNGEYQLNRIQYSGIAPYYHVYSFNKALRLIVFRENKSSFFFTVANVLEHARVRLKYLSRDCGKVS